jgi:phenylalanyl-tRNA synthetase beta chain
MRASYGWLKSYTGSLPPAKELADLLTMSGSAVEAIHEVAGETCFEIEVTTNRSDCLCHLGLAREASAVASTTFHVPEITFEEGPVPVERLAGVEILAADLCPRYTARVIEGVKVAPSPPWLARRIESMGLRPVNNVVDVTNFVMFECNQPLHAFDLDRLRGARIIVRRAEPGETIVAIDGSRHTLTPDRLVIADAERPVAVAGVMGGLATEVGPNTTRILLESAEFNPVSVRRTSRALNLPSDSSYRFERGIDPLGVGWASRRAIQLIEQVAGGRIAQGVIDVDFQEHREPVVMLRFGRIAQVLGLTVPAREVVDILERLEFGVERAGVDSLKVHVPSFRPDVTREIDLIEEVARIYGYGRVPTRPTMRVAVGRVGRRDLLARRLRECLTGAGLFECVTFSMLSQKESDVFTHWLGGGAPVQVDDERRGRDNRLRATLLPSVLKARRTNQDRARVDADLFEIAAVFLPRPGAALPDEPAHLALAVSGDFRAVKGLVEAALDAAGCCRAVAWAPFESRFFEPGQAARITLDGAVLGYAGVVAKSTLEEVGLRRPAAAAELNLDVLAAHANLRPRFERLPEFPGIERDLNVVVGVERTWAEVEQAVRSAGGAFLEDLAFRETYQGAHVPEGRKSVVFSMVFRAADHTLTHEEADAAQAAILAALETTLGAQLRTE